MESVLIKGGGEGGGGVKGPKNVPEVNFEELAPMLVAMLTYGHHSS